jgi:tetratricopeptide (TPR) repeat protein
MTYANLMSRPHHPPPASVQSQPYAAQPAQPVQHAQSAPQPKLPLNADLQTAAVFRRSAEEHMNGENCAGAVTMFSETLRYNPADYEANLGRAIAQLFLGQYDSALTDTNVAVQHNPTSWYPWKTKGDVMAAKGDYTGAEEAYQNALGFASGLDRSQIQRSLTDARLRKQQAVGTPPVVNTPTPSVQQSQYATPPAQATQGGAQQYNHLIPTGGFPAAPRNVSLLPSTPSPALNPVVSATTQQSPYIPILQPSPVTTPVASVVNSSVSIDGRPNIAPSGQSANNTAPPTISRSSTTTSLNEANGPAVPFSATDITTLTEDRSNAFVTDQNNNQVLLSNLDTRLATVENALAGRNRGKAAIRAYSDAQKLDMIKLVYVGMTQAQLTPRELGAPNYLHSSHSRMAISNVTYPGSTFLDMDLESGNFYDGKLPGTVTVSGFSEEYRNQQLQAKPPLNLTLEANVGLPVIDLDRIITRLQFLQTSQYNEDSEGLKPLLGLDA